MHICFLHVSLAYQSRSRISDISGGFRLFGRLIYGLLEQLFYCTFFGRLMTF